MKFDTSDIIRNLEKDIQLTEKQLLELTEKTTLDAQRDLMLATPVDEGTARRGWQATFPTKPYEAGVIENAVPYLSALNDGSSKQAPANFVEGIVQRYNDGGA